MAYLREQGFDGAAKVRGAVSVERSVKDIQHRLEEMVERLNERDVIDARPAIESWMLQAADNTLESRVRVTALAAVHIAMRHIGSAVRCNREDGNSNRYLGSHFGQSLGSRADRLVGYLPHADGLLTDILEVSRETDDAKVSAMAHKAYAGVRDSLTSMTGYVDDPSRAAAFQSAGSVAQDQRPAPRA